MSNYRFFIRPTAAGFNNAAAETAGYVQSGLVWTTVDDVVVGRWNPDSLKRHNVCSLVRVDLQGTILGSDTVRIIASNGQTRKSVVASLDTSGWLFMDPTDSLGIACAGATAAGILVQDLDDEALQQWILAEQSGTIPDFPLPQLEIEATASQAIPAYNGPLIVNINAAADADLTLPALDATTPGMCSITFIRVGNPGQARIVTEDPADVVNGLATVTVSQYFLRSLAESITYRRVADGWQRAAGVQVQSHLATTALPVYAIPAFQEGTLYIEDGLDEFGTMVLPGLADCAQGCRVVIRGNDASTPSVHTLATDDSINGESTFLYPAGNLNSIVVAEHAGDTWNVYSNVAEVDEQLAVTEAGSLEVRGGIVHVNITLADDGDLILPPPGSLPIGTAYVLTRIAGAGLPRIITNGNPVKVNGVTGVTTTQWFLTSIGKSITYRPTVGGWTRDQEWAQQQLVTVSGAGILPSVAGELIANYDSALNNPVVLPALDTVPLGSSIYIYRSGLGTPTITVDDPADEVNGVPAAGGNTWALRFTGNSVLYKRVPNGWWRNTPIIYTGLTSAADIQASTARTQYYQMTGGVGQNLGLPALSTVDVGTTIYAFNSSVNSHSFVPSGTDKIDGVNTTLPQLGPRKSQIVSFGATIGWVTYTTT